MAVNLKTHPRDPIQFAKLIGDIATGWTDDRVENGKDAVASELGRLGGLKGGKARAKKLTREQRADITRIAAAVRWKNRTKLLFRLDLPLPQRHL